MSGDYEAFIPEKDAFMQSLTPRAEQIAKDIVDKQNARQDALTLAAYKNYVIMGGIDMETFGAMSGAGSVIKFRDISSPSIQEIETDRLRHLKIFLHFSKMFIERFPKWELVPEESDPLHKAKLIRKDIGAVICNLYPDNQVAVFGGPDDWTQKYMEHGSRLPIAKVCTQDFYGWALGMDDVPEWIGR